jgi:hypothetical protein
MLAILAASALTVNAAAVATASDSHPSSYTLKGECPFECCTYREWSVDEQTVLYAQPSAGSKQIGSVKAGESVVGLTGEVHATPVRFTVTQAHSSHKPGDVLWVYSYSGEGVFSVWRGGSLQGEELGFSPYGGTGGKRCEEPNQGCWGTLDSELKLNWWVRVRSKVGTVGWSNQPEHFGNKDACG